jgi:hypothetical protein
MKLKPWIHSALHIGCVVLLLLQGHRIWQLRGEVVDLCRQEMGTRERLSDYRLALTSVELRLDEVCRQPHTDCTLK